MNKKRPISLNASSSFGFLGPSGRRSVHKTVPFTLVLFHLASTPRRAAHHPFYACSRVTVLGEGASANLVNAPAQPLSAKPGYKVMPPSTKSDAPWT